MDAWLISPYGQLPGEGWRDNRLTMLGRALAARGHRCTWFTARFDHHTKRDRTDAPRDTFTIELVDTPPYSRNISFGRLRFEYVFGRNVACIGMQRPRPDVIVAFDPPQFSGSAGRALAKHFGVPLVLDCLDLWPELFVTSAPRLLRPFVSIASQPLRIIRRRNLRAAALTVPVVESYRSLLMREGARRVVTIPVGVDVDAVRVERVPHERFTLVYAGSFGERYDLDTLFDAVSTLEDVDLIVAGQGPAEERLRARGLRNVTFAGVVPPHELPQLYARADAGVAAYAPGSTVALPLKFFDYLAAGLPIITSVDSELATVRYTAGDAQSLRDAIARVRSTPPKKTEFEIDANVLYARFVDELEALVR